MTRPSAFEVSYAINPWMRPVEWRHARNALRTHSLAAWQQLHDLLRSEGSQIRLIEAVAGLPDLVFPANAAVVLDRRALLARFAVSERRNEEPVFRSYFENLRELGVLEDCCPVPDDIAQEGAGDCLWDRHRQLFWVGYGQRSQREAAGVIGDYFSCEVQPVELVDSRFYHLDVAMAMLGNGEVLYYPGAFSARSLAAIRERVAPELRLEVTEEEASAFNVNAVCFNGCLFMTPPSERLRVVLAERGYRLHAIDLTPFILAGGAAACLTLRLDFYRRDLCQQAGDARAAGAV